jgi:hypothetical protein
VDKSVPRWTNVPLPNQGSLINFVGLCSHVSQSGDICVELENIAFCSSSNFTPSKNDPRSKMGASPPDQKRRKYSAYAPPRIPVSAAASSRNTTSPSFSSGPVIGASSSTAENTGVAERRYQIFMLLLSLSYLFMQCCLEYITSHHVSCIFPFFRSGQL